MTSMAYNSAAGLSGMLKDGARHFSQDDDPTNAGVVLRNIDACLQLARMLSSSLGPQGRAKLVVNHLNKIIVTSDCASILKEVDVEHPAAQLLKQACEKQQEECGDNTAFVLAFAGELLWQTAKLIGKMTWQPAPEILAGYQTAMQLIESEYIPSLVAGSITDRTDMNQLLRILKPVIASKHYGTEDVLAPLVAKACLQVMNPDNDAVDVSSIRTVKIMGSSVDQCMLLDGYCAKTGVESTVTCKTGGNVKIAVFACGFEASTTEAKGTVLMKNASDLLNYNKTEELKMSDIVSSIAAVGVNVVVVGGNVSDMALHFLNQHKIVCLKMGSKWELRRLCQAVNATALVRLGPPTPDEMGVCDKVQVQEIGGKTVTIFSHEHAAHQKSKLATIVLRASTASVLNDLERAVDNGVQAVAQACKKSSATTGGGKYVYGGGSFEMALSVMLQNKANQVPGLEQYAIAAFGKALEVIPRTLAENAGWDSTRVLANLQAAHASAMEVNANDTTMTKTPCDVGVDIDGLYQSTVDNNKTGGTASMKEKDIVDLLSTKIAALKLAVDAVITILKVDQIIMSKPSGGPKPQ